MNDLKRPTLSMRQEREIQHGGDILTCLLLRDKVHHHRSDHLISTCNKPIYIIRALSAIFHPRKQSQQARRITNLFLLC